jgi:hypothetical protein
MVVLAAIPHSSAGHNAGLAGHGAKSRLTAPTGAGGAVTTAQTLGTKSHPGPKLPSGKSLTAGDASASNHAAPDDDYSIYGNGGHLTAAQLSQMEKQGLAGANVAAVGGATARGAAGSGQSDSPSASVGPHGQQSSGGLGGLNGGALASAAQAGASSTGNAVPGASSGHPGSSAAGVHATAAGGYSRGSGGSSGGDSAGSSLALKIAGLGLVPQFQGQSQLPLQAGYAPVAAKGKQANGGSTDTPNGGGGSSPAAAGGSGGGSSSTGDLPVIPPTANATAAPSIGLMQGYFGDADQLTFSGW